MGAQKPQEELIIAIPYVTGYKQFQDDCKAEKNVIKRKNPYYKSLSKEKFMKRNALNRNRRGRK
jgi:hypothetical protein